MPNSSPIDKSDFDSIEKWEVPFVEDERTAEDVKTTNALNKRSDWKYEPPEKEEILPPTAEEIENIRESARQEGFEQGLAEGTEKGVQEGFEQGQEKGFAQGKDEGYEAGLAEGKEEINELTHRANELIQHLHEPLEKVDQRVKDELIKLSVSLARAVIQTEVKSNDDVLNTALEKGLSALPVNETEIRIHIHPDYETIFDRLVSPETREKNGWQLVHDSTLKMGGIEILSVNNAVNLSIEKRTRDVLDEFLLNHGLAND